MILGAMLSLRILCLSLNSRFMLPLPLAMDLEYMGFSLSHFRSHATSTYGSRESPVQTSLLLQHSSLPPPDDTILLHYATRQYQ